jgi:aconitate hydratase
MGVLPLQFKEGESAGSLGLTGFETYELTGIANGLAPRAGITVRAADEAGGVKTFTVTARVDTPEEVVAFKNGGILPYVLRQLVGNS